MREKHCSGWKKKAEQVGYKVSRTGPMSNIHMFGSWLTGLAKDVKLLVLQGAATIC